MHIRKKILLVILACVTVWWGFQVRDYQKRRRRQQVIQEFNTLFQMPKLNDTATANEISADCTNKQNFQAEQCSNALVIDLGPPGFSMMNIAERSQVYWNVDNDDFTETTNWIGPEDGFLALDKNGDGVINNQSELLGTRTQSGIAALKSYDQDHNKLIDKNDPVLSRLLVWQDKNTDGISQPREISKLTDHGVMSISTESKTLSNMQNDYLIVGELTFTGHNNQVGKIAALRLNYNNRKSRYIKPYYVDSAANGLIATLPDLPGLSDMPDLHTAMAIDAKLLAMVTDLSRQTIPTLLSSNFNVEQKVEEIMLQWAGVSDLPRDCRGGLMQDGRRLAFLEKYFGQEFSEGGKTPSPNPSAEAALLVDQTFIGNRQIILAQFLNASALGQLTYTDWNNPETGQTERIFGVNREALARIKQIAAASPQPLYAWQQIILLLNYRFDLKSNPKTVHVINDAIKATLPDKNLIDVMVSLEQKKSPEMLQKPSLSFSGTLN